MTMMEPQDDCRLTFTVPFYSRTGTELLRRTLASALAQTCSNWRLVVVDDCSPIAGTREAVDSFGDPRFAYHKNERNLGQAGCWNECKKLVRTPFYTILHADDELAPDYAAVMLRAFEKHPDATAIACRTHTIDGDGKRIFSMPDFVKRFLQPGGEWLLEGEEGLRALLAGCFIMCPTVCYQARYTKDFAYTNKWKYTPDLQYWFQLLTHGGRIHGVRERAFRYRRHDEAGTAVAQKNLQMFYDEVGLYDEIAAYCRSRGWRKAAARAERKTILKLRVLYSALSDLARGNSRIALTKARYASSLGRWLPGARA
jgi:glycosyltransferase involved in cell wall biosynthesis